jgi:hypothetical protein
MRQDMRHDLTVCGLFTASGLSKIPEASVSGIDTQKHQIKNEILQMYDQLRAIGIHEHARDFWRIRARKQQQQLLLDRELHEHTALKQYMLWHNQLGVRLPSFMRGGDTCLTNFIARKRAQPVTTK